MLLARSPIFRPRFQISSRTLAMTKRIPLFLLLLMAVSILLYLASGYLNQRFNALHLLAYLRSEGADAKLAVPNDTGRHGSTNRGGAAPPCTDIDWRRVYQDWAGGRTPIPRFDAGDPCLLRLVKGRCHDNRTAPNVVHYVWLSRHAMKFYTLISMLSSHRILAPCFILIHGDYLPSGRYWRYFLFQRPRVIHVVTRPPDAIFGKRISRVEHKADILRLEIMQVYGGIYMDCDQIALKSFDRLRNYQCVLGQETDGQLGNALIIAESTAPFLRMWYSAYHTYNPSQWAVHSTVIPFQLSRVVPQLIHIERGTIYRPNYTRKDLLYEKNIDWSGSYSIHMYHKGMKMNYNPEIIKTMNATFGSVARFILYGTKDFIFSTKSLS